MGRSPGIKSKTRVHFVLTHFVLVVNQLCFPCIHCVETMLDQLFLELFPPKFRIFLKSVLWHSLSVQLLHWWSSCLFCRLFPYKFSWNGWLFSQVGTIKLLPSSGARNAIWWVQKVVPQDTQLFKSQNTFETCISLNSHISPFD